MDVKLIRVRKLKAFVEEQGGAASLAKKHEAIDASYLSQLINGHRPFGEKSARKIEQTCGLSTNYFDSDQTDESHTSQKSFDMSDRLQVLHRIAQQLPDYALDEVIRDALKTAELIAKATEEAHKPNGTK